RGVVVREAGDGDDTTAACAAGARRRRAAARARRRADRDRRRTARGAAARAPGPGAGRASAATGAAAATAAVGAAITVAGVVDEDLVGAREEGGRGDEGDAGGAKQTAAKHRELGVVHARAQAGSVPSSRASGGAPTPGR